MAANYEYDDKVLKWCGCATLIFSLHWSLSWASSQDIPKLFISSLRQS